MDTRGVPGTLYIYYQHISDNAAKVIRVILCSDISTPMTRFNFGCWMCAYKNANEKSNKRLSQ